MKYIVFLFSILLHSQSYSQGVVINPDGSIVVPLENQKISLENVDRRSYKIDNLTAELVNRKGQNSILLKKNDSCKASKGAVNEQFEKLVYQSDYQTTLINSLRERIALCEDYNKRLQRENQKLKSGIKFWKPARDFAIVGVLILLISIIA